MENRPESLTLEQLQQQNAKQEQQIAELSAKLKWYEEQFRLAQQKRFGACYAGRPRAAHGKGDV
jgi:transposase